MKKLILSSVFLLSFCMISFTQEVKLSVELSTDTVLIGNYLKVKFTLENASARFEAPVFEGFRVISGPNVSSSMSFINGKLTQKTSYEYFLDPEDIGQLFIGEAYFVTEPETYATEPLEVWVLPNPDGIKQEPDIKLLDEYYFNQEPSDKEPKKKIKAKRHKI